MELKNAVAVCLLALFSATLVLLIARALDLQAAARLEPQLARIVEELEGLRRQGGLVSGAAADQADSPRVIVYYFHGKKRCVTCLAVEAQAHDVVQADFAAEVESGAVAWKVLNYQEPAGAALAKKFKISSFAVVLATMQGGEIVQWKRLDRVGALVGDKPRYATYVRDEISQMVRAVKPQAGEKDSDDQPAAEKPVPPPVDLPIPE